MPTPHNEAKKGDIAKIVLMPGDPLRAKYIAETFLEQKVQFNTVRNMLGFTGTYKGKKISVMGSGMGMPSMGIYSYELFSFYDVDAIIRIGSAGAMIKDLKLYDIVLAESAWSESSYAFVQNKCTEEILFSDKSLNWSIESEAKKLGYPIVKGRTHSSDVFYHGPEADDPTVIHEKHACICVEMESFALFHNANVTGKKAGCLLTISDNLVTHEEISSREREQAFHQMMEISLETAINTGP
ncbi:MAG: purine-nucleoside phosphorylase [Acetobacterium sp.]